MSKIVLTEQAAPDTPDTDKGEIYIKTDSILYFKNDAGTEFNLTSGGNPFKGTVRIMKAMPTNTLAATVALEVGGSSPKELVSRWDFNQSTIEYMDFMCYLDGYSGGGLTFSLFWSAQSNTNQVRWEIGIRRVADDAEDINTSHSYDYNVFDATAPSAEGEVDYVNISFTDGTDMDNWADGEIAIVRVRRNASHVNDNMVQDAELWSIIGKET